MMNPQQPPRPDHGDFGATRPRPPKPGSTVEQPQPRRNRVISPVLVVVLFLVFGLLFKLWHPGWLLLLTIPLLGRRIRSFSDMITDPVILIIAFLVLGIFFKLWHPGWMILLLIIIGTLLKKRR